MVNQCFAIQSTYGKTAEQLDILMDAMVYDLGGYNSTVVRAAFDEWRKTKRIIPTPADIIALCDKYKARHRHAKIKHRPAKPVPKPYEPYFYEGKFWAQFEEYERQQFVTDLAQLPAHIGVTWCEIYHAPVRLVK